MQNYGQAPCGKTEGTDSRATSARQALDCSRHPPWPRPGCRDALDCSAVLGAAAPRTRRPLRAGAPSQRCLPLVAIAPKAPCAAHGPSIFCSTARRICNQRGGLARPSRPRNPV